MAKKSFFIILSLFLFSSLFAATMNPKVRQVPKIIKEQIFVTPEETLPELVKFLTGSVSDTISKVKLLHDWICDNIAYDVDVFTEDGAGLQDYESVLKKRKAVCVGYANLMSAMCYYAKIEVDIIPGWSKGFNYPGYLREKSDHAWNAVKIGGRWKLIDVTWDAGFVDYGTFIKHYSDNYLNLTPAQFIYSHFPEDEKWQLLNEKEIRSPERFVKEPFVPGIFFEYGIAFGKDSPDYKNEIFELSGFDFITQKQNVSLVADIYSSDSYISTDNFVLEERSGNKKRFIFDVPNKEDYKFRVGARINGTLNNPTHFSRADFVQNLLPQAQALLADKKITKTELELFEKSYFLVEENHRYYFQEDLFDGPRNSANTKILKLLKKNTSRYENILTVDLKASQDYEGAGDIKYRFPTVYLGYESGSVMKINEPLSGILKSGSEQHFSISTNAYPKLALVCGEKQFELFKKNPKTGACELDFKIPQDLAEIHIYASKDGKEYMTIISYKVE